MALRDGWFVRVKAAVDAVDPVGLLGLGAPKDEYYPEAAEFAGMARSGQQLAARVVVAVFDRRFEAGACSLVQAGRIAALLVTWQRGWWAWSVVEGHATRSFRHDTGYAAAGGTKP